MKKKICSQEEKEVNQRNYLHIWYVKTQDFFMGDIGKESLLTR